jgi:hypothetical protein
MSQQPEIQWEAHLRRDDDAEVTPERPNPPAVRLDLRGRIAVTDDTFRYPLRGSVLRGSADLMTTRIGRGPNGEKYGMRSKFNFVTGKGVPIDRVHLSRILVRNVVLVGDDKYRSIQLDAVADGPWVPATKWDHFVLPILQDGCMTSLGALADAMEEDGDPLAPQIGELFRYYQPHGGPRAGDYRVNAAVAEVFLAAAYPEVFGGSHAAQS